MAREPGSSEPIQGGPAGEVADRRQLGRLVTLLVALLVGVIFVVQNSDRVELRFLFLDVTTRVWAGLVVALALGAVLGQAAEAVWNRRRRDRD